GGFGSRPTSATLGSLPFATSRWYCARSHGLNRTVQGPASTARRAGTRCQACSSRRVELFLALVLDAADLTHTRGELLRATEALEAADFSDESRSRLMPFELLSRVVLQKPKKRLWQADRHAPQRVGEPAAVGLLVEAGERLAEHADAADAQAVLVA